MKQWLHKFLLLLWPWNKIDELEKALKESNRQIIIANDRYNSAYNDGFRHHLQAWMANANAFYGKEPFSDMQKNVMIEFYNRGYTVKDALDMLYISENRNPHGVWTR